MMDPPVNVPTPAGTQAGPPWTIWSQLPVQSRPVTLTAVFLKREAMRAEVQLGAERT
jgi:hypothetical protein